MERKHHICIEEHVTILDGKALPLGYVEIEEKITEALSTLLEDIVPHIGRGDVVVCGKDPARRMLGRKLEDRLGREVVYE